MYLLYPTNWYAGLARLQRGSAVSESVPFLVIYHDTPQLRPSFRDNKCRLFTVTTRPLGEFL